MGTRKYDSAAYLDSERKNEPQIINIEDLIAKMNKDKSYFTSKYANNLYCPECNAPQLTLCSSKRGYFLRGFPNQDHKDDCGFGLDEVPSNEFEKVLVNNPDERTIRLRLNQVIDSLLKRIKTKYHPLAVSINNNTIDFNLIPRENIKRNGTKKTIPCKSLTAPFLDEDYDRFMVFYGRVEIRWETRHSSKDPTEAYHVLKIYKRGAKYPFCSGTVNDNDFNGIMNNVDCDRALISFYTTMKKKGKYTNFVINSKRIIIEKE